MTGGRGSKLAKNSVTYFCGQPHICSPSSQILSTCSAIDKSRVSLLAPFDVSSAFDMVDHEILLKRLETSYGLQVIPLQWLRSYLSERTQIIVSGNSRTKWLPITMVVPQGSVLGSVVLIMYQF